MRQAFEVRGGGEMLHQDFAGRFAFERHAAGQHLVEDDSQAVDVDLRAVLAVGDFRGHVVDGADALRVLPAAGTFKPAREADVADFDDAMFAVDVGRFEIAMDDPVLVQEPDACGDPCEPGFDFADRQSVGEGRQDVFEAAAADVFHDDPGPACAIDFDIKQIDQVGVLQVEALRDPAQLFLRLIGEDQLERDLFARVRDGEIDFAESAAADWPADRISRQRS